MASEKISMTGYVVASALNKLAALPDCRGYFAHDAILLNTAFARHNKNSWVKRGIDFLSPKMALWVMDTLFIPGLMYHYVFRKRYIEERVISAIANGARQVVNLGAGFDTLFVRLAKEYPQVQLFEVDLPDIQTAKVRTLTRIHYDVRSNCHFVPADLAKTRLQETLSSLPSFDPAAPAVVILEGVLMYLAESEVRRLFLELHTLFQSRLTVIFGATSASSRHGNWSMRVIHYLLRRSNEGEKWHCSSEDIPHFIEKQRYMLKEWISYKDLQGSKPQGSKIPEKGENYYLIEKL